MPERRVQHKAATGRPPTRKVHYDDFEGHANTVASSRRCGMLTQNPEGVCSVCRAELSKTA